MPETRYKQWLAIPALLITLTSLGAGQDAAERGVARVSVIQGDVSVKRGDSGEYVAATVNAPLVVEDFLATGSGSRAEIQFDSSNMLRLAANTDVRLTELEADRYQMQVARGTVTFRVLRDTTARVEISTPSISVRPDQRGIYRVTVSEDGQTEVTVRAGSTEVYSPRGAERVNSGRSLLVRGTAADPEFQYIAAGARDDWDTWNDRRDRDLERSRSYAYVSRDIYGAEDLDAYGEWVPVPEYGTVWRPRVAVGWAPYRLGRWSWVDYYGWTWVSYDPWGWAPYHYGRWFNNPGYGWCWYPGAIRARYSWSPALVAFFGFGGGVGVGVGFGNVGWVPLAPYDPFNRWWGRGYYGGYRQQNIINNIHIVNNTDMRGLYRNARVHDAVTGVRMEDFNRGRFGGNVRVPEAEIQRAHLVRGQLPIAPSQQNLRFTDHDARVTRGADVGSQRYFSHTQASRVDRVPFDQQRRTIEQASRTAFGGGTAAGNSGGVMRPEGRDGRRDATGAAAASPGAQGANRGWRQAGDQRATGGASATQVDRGLSGRDDRGWSRFGEPAARHTDPSMSTSGGSAGPNINRTQTGDRGWRRFGEPTGQPDAVTRSRAGEAQRSEPRNGEVRNNVGQDSNSWRRFGEAGRNGGGQNQQGNIPRQEPGRQQMRSEQPRSAAEGASGGWSRFGNGMQPGQRSSVYGSAADGGFRGMRSSGERLGSSQPLQISPPVIHERSAPRSMSAPSIGRSMEGRQSMPTRSTGGSAPQGHGGGGGGHYSGGGGHGGGGRGR